MEIGLKLILPNEAEDEYEKCLILILVGFAQSNAS